MQPEEEKTWVKVSFWGAGWRGRRWIELELISMLS